MGGATGSPKWDMKWGVHVNSEVKPVGVKPTQFNCTGCKYSYINPDGTHGCAYVHKAECMKGLYRTFKEVK